MQVHFEATLSYLIFVGIPANAFQILKPSDPSKLSIFGKVSQLVKYLVKISAHSFLPTNLKVIELFVYTL